jgi:hypothetical protein
MIAFSRLFSCFVSCFVSTRRRCEPEHHRELWHANTSQNPLPAQRHDVAAMPTATVAAVAVVMPAPEMLVVVLVPSDATAVMVAAVTVGVTLEPPTEIASPAGVCDIG